MGQVGWCTTLARLKYLRSHWMDCHTVCSIITLILARAITVPRGVTPVDFVDPLTSSNTVAGRLVVLIKSFWILTGFLKVTRLKPFTVRADIINILCTFVSVHKIRMRPRLALHFPLCECTPPSLSDSPLY